MSFRTILAILVTFGLLAACAHIDPHPMDMTNALRNAETTADHLALARHYEAAAAAMRAKAQEQKDWLSEFRKHGYFYGRKTEELKEHTLALIRVYEEAAEANMSMAKSQRETAAEAER